MRISLLNNDGTSLFDMFHCGDLSIQDVITSDTIKINNDENNQIEIVVNGVRVFPITGDSDD
jgi:hypothetical protein